LVLARGVHSVLVTPFAPDESVDEASVGTLVDYCVAAGVAGVLVLGVLGEADRLSDAERERMIAVVLERAAGRVQVTVGVTHQSTEILRRRGAIAHATVRRPAAAVDERMLAALDELLAGAPA
jgi:4-hydroxy-tetrahydrodipicolinate synthase